MQHLWGQFKDFPAIEFGVPAKEMLGQQRNVVPPFPQRGQGNRHDVEPVVQVLAEAARLDFVLERFIGGGDHAHIHADRLGVAESFELPFLQHPQQFDLQFGGHAGNFIKEDRPAVGGLEPAGLVFDRPGEGAFDVPEQLAFQQVFVQGAAIDADIWAGRAVAAFVDRPGNDFLAGAGLANEQNAGIRGRGQTGEAIHLAHREGISHDVGQQRLFRISACHPRARSMFDGRRMIQLHTA